MSCSFCDDLATYRYLPHGVVTYGPPSVAFCRWHLLRYYLSLA